MQKVGDVSKNGKIFQKENRVGYPHPHSPPKPNNTKPFATTIIILQIVNHPQIIVNLKNQNAQKHQNNCEKSQNIDKFCRKTCG